MVAVGAHVGRRAFASLMDTGRMLTDGCSREKELPEQIVSDSAALRRSAGWRARGYRPTS